MSRCELGVGCQNQLASCFVNLLYQLIYSRHSCRCGIGASDVYDPYAVRVSSDYIAINFRVLFPAVTDSDEGEMRVKLKDLLNPADLMTEVVSG